MVTFYVLGRGRSIKVSIVAVPHGDADRTAASFNSPLLLLVNGSDPPTIALIESQELICASRCVGRILEVT